MDPKVTHNSRQHRFESQQGNLTAVLDYRVDGERITFTHTGVPKAMEGRGIGTSLVEAGLEYARERQLQVVPQCPFVADYMAKHPKA
jgi:predicted GNAT family acetyltransferase